MKRGTRVLPVALAAALLAACSATPPRQDQAPNAPASAVPPSPSAAALPSPALNGAASTATPDAIRIVAPDSPWPRIRERIAMKNCDYRPQVMRWARRFTESPKRFEASLRRALPFVVLVTDEIERRGLPGEFAMLPYIESSYEPVYSRGDRPAGMWQLMPDTARNAGLTVSADFDERLDAVASTSAALGLIERYERQFSDWRLADMAFNSGEYKVRALLKDRDAQSMSPAELGKVAFNPVTHDHLDRLLALSCIVSHPEQFAVTLPEPKPGEQLKSIALTSGMDVRLAARLAGLDVDAMQRYNAAYRRNRMAPGKPYALLMPAASVDRFQASAQTIPAPLWNDWREQRAARTSGLASWAAEVGIPVAVLATANAIAEESTVSPTTRLLLPGREKEIADEALPEKAAPTHVVKSGDTLSSIAHRYKLSAAEIARLNPALRNKTLHIGDRVRVVAGTN